MSCSNKYNLIYAKTSKAYIKKDAITDVYYGYSEDLGLKIPFFNIDSIHYPPKVEKNSSFGE